MSRELIHNCLVDGRHYHSPPGGTAFSGDVNECPYCRPGAAAGDQDVPLGDPASYGRYLRNVLSFKTVEAAKESVAQIARLYSYFERIGDRAGQHHVEVLALTGRNRARFSGKKEESRIFEEWLFNH